MLLESEVGGNILGHAVTMRLSLTRQDPCCSSMESSEAGQQAQTQGSQCSARLTDIEGRSGRLLQLTFHSRIIFDWQVLACCNNSYYKDIWEM